jgi:uncharacterized protein
MQLRDFDTTDFKEILRLNKESEHFLSPLDAPRLALLAGEASVRVVVEITQEKAKHIAGFLICFREGCHYDSPNYRWFAARYARFLYIDRVVVSQHFLGRGVGKLLYQEMLQRARLQDITQVCCEYDLDPPNPVSAGFHHDFGFHEVGQQTVGAGKKIVSLQTLTLSANSIVD